MLKLDLKLPKNIFSYGTVRVSVQSIWGECTTIQRSIPAKELLQYCRLKNVSLFVIKLTSFASERDFRFKLPRKVTNHNMRIIKYSLRFCF